MTVKEYIESKLSSFGIRIDVESESIMAGVSDLDVEISDLNAATVGSSLCSIMEGIILMPKEKSINESGFSVSWDYSGLVKYYLWLCKKYGHKADSDIVAMSGISVIRDKSGVW